MDYIEYEHVKDLTLGRGVVIAIDGPSGSGKSTVARQVAAALDMGYLDTGAMYRAAAWWCEYQHIDLNDAAAVSAAVKSIKMEVQAVPHAPRILVEGMDVMKVIREKRIAEIVSQVSSVQAVRDHLISMQKDIIKKFRESGRGIVVEGRDITTVVAPEAPVRILLTAAEDVRMARRAKDDFGVVDEAALAAEQDMVLGRDRKDAAVTQFYEAGEGVIKIDSTDLSLHETIDTVVYQIENLIK